MCEKSTTSISEEELFSNEFVKVHNTRFFNITPNVAYRRYYKFKNDQCPIFVIKHNGEFCHVVPAINALECTFIPIKTPEQLRLLIEVLSGKTETENNCSSK